MPVGPSGRSAGDPCRGRPAGRFAILACLQRKALALAYWCVPPLFALLVYSRALGAWFHEDDFVWLNLLPNIHSWGDLSYALFEPTIHGTWRPLGERVFFLTLQALFGYTSALPFRIAAFAWQFANLALVSAITLRITRSRLAGFFAPILWMASDKQITIMEWTSAINYVSCAFFLLLALWFLIRHTETAKVGYLIAMWAAFLCSLGALEMAVVFPAIAASYTWVCARKYVRKTLLLFAASAAFALLHARLAPDQAVGPYHMHFDASLLSTFGQYWRLAMIPVNLADFTRFPAVAGPIAMVLFTVALLGFVGYQAVARRNLVPAMFAAWFVVLIAPVLPLRDHVTDYYLALPLMGLAMLAADAIAKAWDQPAMFWRGCALALCGLFLAESIPVAYNGTGWFADRSEKVRTMVLAVDEAQHRHRGATVLLRGLDDDLFWGAVQQHCFLFLGYDAYIDASNLAYIGPHPEVTDPAKFVLPDEKIRELYARRQLAVYRWIGDGVVDETSSFAPGAPAASAESARAAPGDRVDVANPNFSDRLSDAWYPIAQDSRWMPKRAAVRMRSGDGAAHTLRISGYCPAVLLKNGPLHLTVSIGGVAMKPVAIDKPDAPFQFDFPLQAGLAKEFEVQLEVDRTTRVPPDERDLGLPFGVFEIVN